MTTCLATAETAPTQAARLRELAQVVRFLMPDRRRPEEFHEAKSEVVAALRADRSRAGAPKAMTGHRAVVTTAAPASPIVVTLYARRVNT